MKAKAVTLVVTKEASIGSLYEFFTFIKRGGLLLSVKK